MKISSYILNTDGYLATGESGISNIYDIHTFENKYHISKKYIRNLFFVDNKFILFDIEGKIYTSYSLNDNISRLGKIPFEYYEGHIFHIYGDWFVTINIWRQEIWKFNYVTGKKVKMFYQENTNLDIIKVENDKIYFCSYFNDNGIQKKISMNFYIMNFNGNIINSFSTMEKWCHYGFSYFWTDDRIIIIDATKNIFQGLLSKSYYIEIDFSGETIYKKIRSNEFTALRTIQYKDNIIICNKAENKLMLWNYKKHEIDCSVHIETNDDIQCVGYNIIGNRLFVNSKNRIVVYEIED